MLFSSSSIDEDAAILLGICIIGATSDATKRLRSRPALAALNSQPIQDWEYFLTCAGLAIGLTMYQMARGRENAQPFMAALLRATQHWPHGVGVAVLDFQNVTNRLVTEEQLRPETAIGWWIALNVKGAPLSDEELTEAPTIGETVLHAVDRWRDACEGAKA
jgi:hypothetical protein